MQLLIEIKNKGAIVDEEEKITTVGYKPTDESGKQVLGLFMVAESMNQHLKKFLNYIFFSRTNSKLISSPSVHIFRSWI